MDNSVLAGGISISTWRVSGLSTNRPLCSLSPLPLYETPVSRLWVALSDFGCMRDLRLVLRGSPRAGERGRLPGGLSRSGQERSWCCCHCTDGEI